MYREVQGVCSMAERLTEQMCSDRSLRGGGRMGFAETGLIHPNQGEEAAKMVVVRSKGFFKS